MPTNESNVSPVANNTVFTWLDVNIGRYPINKAAKPATCGAAMEVPL
ncbi:MAG: hypothetical protein WCV88_01325 [Patescibacteria group bacterium]